MAEQQLPIAVSQRAIEIASGLSRPRIRGLIANGKLRQVPGAPRLIQTGSVIAVFGDEIRDRLAGILAASLARRQRAGKNSQLGKKTSTVSV